LFCLQDARGAPVSLMNDPMHYPHGTKFMAPGARCCGSVGVVVRVCVCVCE